MGRFVDHSISRVEFKRLIEKAEDYRLSYNFDITRREIENKILEIDYVFTITYNIDVGTIVIEGSTGYKDGPKKLKDINKNWENELDFHRRLYNMIFRNAITVILDLSRHVGLPPPLVFPKIKIEPLE